MSYHKELKKQFLEHALVHVPFDGWNEKLFSKVAAELNVELAYPHILFPNGVIDLVNFFMDSINDDFAVQAQATPVDTLSIREKIFTLIKMKLQLSNAHKHSIRRALAFYSLPPYLVHNMKSLHSSVDQIWHLAKDQSTDFSYYTKRLTLAGIYVKVVWFWLNDYSADNEDSWVYLKRNIESVLVIGKLKNNCKKFIRNIPFVRLLVGKNQVFESTLRP